jgi:glycosyltransferase involved in cell wall biosynthesis
MKVSIITVVLNNKTYIEDCINSVLSQTHKNVECIVIDGGSTDGTVEIVRKYKEYISLWVSEADQGIYDAMNKGISLATGDIIGILNADDFYSHNHVLSKISEVFADKSLDSSYGDLAYIDARDLKRIVRIWRSGLYRENSFYRGWMPPHPTFFVRREIYEKYGAYNLTLGTAADYELMLRLLVRHRISTAHIPEVLVKMRTGGQSNVSLKNRIRANRMDRLAWKINGLKPRSLTLWMKPLRKVTQFLPSLTTSLNRSLR